jgi:N-acetylglucosamine-6-phosphate deacetylase
MYPNCLHMSTYLQFLFYLFLVGVHLEGPFISRTKCGAHSHEAVAVWENLPITYETIRSCYGSLDGVKIVTLAPELEGMYDVIRELSAEPHKIAVSLGHSEANLRIAEKAVHCGARGITHLFNAMLPFHHRDPGIVGLLASLNLPKDCTVYFGLISDGVHTDLATVRIAHKACQKGVVLVTDAIAAMGLSHGMHKLGTQNIKVLGCEDGSPHGFRQSRVFVEGQEILAGGLATMELCVQRYQKATDCTIEQALECATLHPAQLLGMESDIGTLNFGSRADFVLLNNDLFVQETYIGGQSVYSKRQS